jgi:hypothetical protein
MPRIKYTQPAAAQEATDSDRSDLASTNYSSYLDAIRPSALCHKGAFVSSQWINVTS